MTEIEDFGGFKASLTDPDGNRRGVTGNDSESRMAITDGHRVAQMIDWEKHPFIDLAWMGVLRDYRMCIDSRIKSVIPDPDSAPRPPK